MTQGHPFAPTNYPAQYHDLENGQDEDLSPSDGYFGSNNSIPDTVLIPNPSVSSFKAQEAATESSSDGPQSPLETRYMAYTPATTYTPATSSRGSQSAYDGSVSGYRNSEQALSERSPLLEEPPPLYDDAVAQAAGSSGLTGRDNPVSSPHSGCNSIQVREPVSSLSNSVSAGSGVPQSMSVGVDNCSRKAHDEESDPARPRRSRCRGCCGRKKDRKKRHSRFRRFLALLLGTVLAIWLISDLAKIAIHFYRVFHVFFSYPLKLQGQQLTGYSKRTLPRTIFLRTSPSHRLLAIPYHVANTASGKALTLSLGPTLSTTSWTCRHCLARSLLWLSRTPVICRQYSTWQQRRGPSMSRSMTPTSALPEMQSI